MNKYILHASSAIALALLAPSANAQVNEAPPQNADQVTLGEIVVTAQRKSERLQDTPVTVSAFSSEMLESRSITGTADLAQAVPNLVMYQQATSVTPFLRGIGTKNSVAGDENSVATYVDGVYISSAAAGIFALSNIERIEVLRGPQGTLFGRNAAAGVVQVITKTPSHDPYARASIGYGNYDTFEGSFYGTTGISDSVAADLAVYYNHQEKGFGKNLFDGKDIRYGEELAIRSKWKADLADDTTLTVAMDYDYMVPQLAALFRARPGHVLQGNIAYPGFYNANINYAPQGHNKQWGASATLDHDFGPMRFLSITAFRSLSADVNFDADGTPTLLQQANINQQSRTFSQEFQFASPSGSSIDWIVGTFFWLDKTRVDPLHFMLPTITFDRFTTQKSTSIAAFGQATIPLGSATNFIAGLRYTRDTRQLNGRDVRPTSTTVYPQQNETFPKLTWRASLDHRFSPEAMVYLQYNRGFKSGVFNMYGPADPAARPQTVDTYEAGLKTDLLGRKLRFNIAAFYNDFSDIQLQVPVGVGQPTRLYNAAKGRTYGIETEFEARPTRNFLISGGVAYLNTRYSEFPFAPYFFPGTPNDGRQVAVVQSGKGNEFLIAPKWTANISGTYTIPTSFGQIDLNASDAWQSRFFFDVENRIREPARHIVNASIDISTFEKAWSLSLWAKNLTKTKYHANIVPASFGDTGYPGAPRTYGVRVGHKF